MNFLEAHRLVAEFRGGESLPFLFAISGTADPFVLYLKAVAATRGRAADVRLLPFNTLGQTLAAPANAAEREAFLLFPWDLVPEADWRSGVLADEPDETALRERAATTLASLSRRPNARLLYVAAPMLPLWTQSRRNESLGLWLASEAHASGARILDGAAFSLGTYLASGCPVGGAELGTVAEAVVARVLETPSQPAKVLITDLDNTLWGGIVGDDGVEGLHYGPEGTGYTHFVYQTYLARLRREGVLLAAVSKNDAAVALAPIKTGRMVLKEEDFVAVLASWNAKSAQIRQLAGALNLGLDSMTVVDDNEVELAEIGLELPEVQTLRFPAQTAELPALLSALGARFGRAQITAEDRQRTEMYRRRLEGMVPSDVEGADLTQFLRDLKMRLLLHDRSRGDRTRAVQLINKTNQFNLNGRRITDVEVGAILDAGGRLYSATLEDRTGSHGEILACLVDAAGIVTSFVMSCRVFQRRVERAFVAWLVDQSPAPVAFSFEPTARNEPLRTFLTDAVGPLDGPADIPVDAGALAGRYSDDLALFDLQRPTED